MAAAIPFAPMIIGAGAGAIMDKGNPMRGAMLGAVGGSIAGPIAGAIGGVGGATAAAPTMAAMPAQAAGSAAAAGAGGLPSMGSLMSSMPGAMPMPGLMGVNGLPFGANAATLASAYNAMPVMSKLGGLAESYMTPKNAMQGTRGLFQMGGQQEQPPMAPAPIPMPAMPQNRPPMPVQPVSMFRTSPLRRRM
jgi:hypothetical protein